MKLFLLVISLCSLLVPAGLLADCETKEILIKVEEHAKLINDISFNFSQKITMSYGDYSYIISGKASFKKPNLFKLEYIKPEKQIIISDGKTLFTYSEKLNQVTIDNGLTDTDFAGIIRHVCDLPEFIKNLSNEYEISCKKKKNGFYSIICDPKQTSENQKKIGADNEKIIFWISERTYMAEILETKTETATSLFTISDVKTNTDIDNKYFTYKIPKGVRIISNE